MCRATTKSLQLLLLAGLCASRVSGNSIIYGNRIGRTQKTVERYKEAGPFLGPSSFDYPISAR